jgi:hypothetical protein
VYVNFPSPLLFKTPRFPMWFAVVEILGAYIGMSWIGGKTGTRIA